MCVCDGDDGDDSWLKNDHFLQGLFLVSDPMP